MQGSSPSKLSRKLYNVRKELRTMEKEFSRRPITEGSDEHKELEALRDTYVEELLQSKRDRVVARVNGHTTAESARVLAAVGAVNDVVLDVGSQVNGLEGRLNDRIDSAVSEIITELRPTRRRRLSPGSSAAAAGAAATAESSTDVPPAMCSDGGSRCTVVVKARKGAAAHTCGHEKAFRTSLDGIQIYACRYHFGYKHAARARPTVPGDDAPPTSSSSAAPAAPVTRQLTMAESVDRLFDKSQSATVEEMVEEPAAPPAVLPPAEQTAVEPPFDPRPADRSSSATLGF